MNKLFDKVLKISVMLAAVLSVCMMASSNSYATTYETSPYIILESYSVEGDMIVPGEQFKLIMTIKNVDDKSIAHEVVVSLTASTGILPNYQEVPQVYVGDLKPGETKTIEYGCTALDSCAPPSALFNVSITSDARNNSVTISVPVKKNTDVFTVFSANVTSEAYAGDAIVSEIRFKADEQEAFSDVSVEIYVDDQLYDINKIGSMLTGAIKTQNSTIYLYDIGEHEVEYIIKCTDSKGGVKSVEAYKGKVNVLEKKADVATNLNNNDSIVYTNSDIGIMVGCLLGAVILLGGIVFVAKRNR